ncbi:hypothetical protein FF38_05350 [Lucilia cuprina]|uniref:Uncharacterized protein n=1 Tax=Lucilia cuprina TaxID=7375 RepID=A0A0L0BQP1_LUCCU|nr:hypothetical protein FF38_05350 [Lucilia cuprina]
MSISLINVHALYASLTPTYPAIYNLNINNNKSINSNNINNQIPTKPKTISVKSLLETRITTRLMGGKSGNYNRYNSGNNNNNIINSSNNIYKKTTMNINEMSSLFRQIKAFHDTFTTTNAYREHRSTNINSMYTHTHIDSKQIQLTKQDVLNV